MKRLSNIDELASFIKSRADKKTVVTFHSIGDRDCVGAAFAMKNILLKSEIHTPDFITNNARKMLEHIGIKKAIKTGIKRNEELIVI